MSATYDAINWDWHRDGEGNLVSVQLRAAPLPVAPKTDVRSGVEHLDGVGDVAVPAAADVRSGVAVDHTVGTLDVSGGGPVLPTSTESERWFSTMVSIRGASITYQRGATSATITCVPMGAELTSDEYSGTIRRADAKDFVILSSSFGSFVLPARGDQITHSGITYRVGEPPYRQMSVDGKVIRIFTERI